MKTLAAKVGKKVYTECDLFAAVGAGCLIGSLYTFTILVLLHKMHGAF